MLWPWASLFFGGLTAGLATLLSTPGDPNKVAGVTVFTLVGGFFGWVAKFVADDARARAEAKRRASELKPK